MLQHLIVGDTLATTITLASWPASAGWVLHYRLIDRAGVNDVIEFQSTAAGDSHALLVDAATTAAWKPGEYSVAAWVRKGTERYTVVAECGQITLKPDPAALLPGVDTRSQAVRTLQAIRDKIAGKATDGVNRYRINDREVQSYSVAELIKLEDFWARQVAAEERAAGIANPRGQSRHIRVVMR